MILQSIILHQFQAYASVCDQVHGNFPYRKMNEAIELLPLQGHLHVWQIRDVLLREEHLACGGAVRTHILQTYHFCNQRIPCLFPPLIKLLRTIVAWKQDDNGINTVK